MTAQDHDLTPPPTATPVATFSEPQEPVAVHALLRRATRRLLLQKLVAALMLGVVFSLVLALATVLVHRLLVPQWSLEQALIWLLPLGPVLGVACVFFLRRGGDVATALELERHVDLRERFSSLLTMGGESIHAEVKTALIRDGERHAEGVSLKRALPFRRPLALLPAIAALGILALAYFFFPELDVFGAGEQRERAALAKEREQKRVERVRKRARTELERIQKRAEEARVPKETKRLIARMQERLQRDEQRQEPQRRQALVGMQKMREELKARRNRDEMKNLERFLDQVRRSAPMETPEALQVAKALKQGNLEKAAEGMQQIAKKMQKAMQESGGLDSEETAALKRDLDRLMKDLELPGADELAKKLMNSAGLDPADLARLFDEAGGQMSDLARLMRERDVLDQALNEIKFSQDELAALPQEWPESDDPGG